ncbi:hypothetical protein [Methanorbis rubei]|uniref:Transmembrane protein n=1 Tax=Methanorbis rubei TaxID=3028300 RepID=A0AAE4MFL8_9EURY|nr:hypothetical protein [Methanocorpusculaceae archaeon Cs1]
MESCVYANNYDTRSARHSGFFPLLIGIILIIGIIGGLVFAGIMAMDRIVENVEKNAAVIVHLYGDDIEVMILSSSFEKEITSIEISIDEVPDSRRIHPVTLGTPFLFKNIAVGVTGSKFVVINAVFTDGSSTVIHYTKFQFS